MYYRSCWLWLLLAFASITFKVLVLCCVVMGSKQNGIGFLNWGRDYLVRFPCSHQNACFTAAFHVLVFISFSGFDTVLKNTASHVRCYMMWLCHTFFFFFFFLPFSLQLLRCGFIGSHRLKGTLRGHLGQTPAQNTSGVEQLAQSLGQLVLYVTKDVGSNSDEFWGLGVLWTAFMRCITWMWAAVTYN